MPRTVAVTIGGAECTVTELRARQSAAWLQKVYAAASEAMETVGDPNAIAIEGVADLLRVAKQLGPLVLGKLSEAVELCIAFDERFAEAYGSEIVDALPKLVALCIPFGETADILSLLGLRSTPTSPSSVSASGDAGTTS